MHNSSTILKLLLPKRNRLPGDDLRIVMTTSQFILACVIEEGRENLRIF
jgi:hypothetical protein